MRPKMIFRERIPNQFFCPPTILSGAFTGRRLAKLGINDNMAARIRSEFEKHGEVINGWHIGNFEKWDD
ncbi:hypothetical protein YA49_21965 [Enterobacter cloacae subsp. cloacae]|nr:hypothetical protein YA49_21965 [Enterobacter cloacae subsp. cloacae]